MPPIVQYYAHVERTRQGEQKKSPGRGFDDDRKKRRGGEEERGG
jgi:hypothetical protein